MVKFRDNDAVKKRLTAFFNTALSEPVFFKQTKDDLLKKLSLEDGEFFIISYSTVNSVLVVTSRRLVIEGEHITELSFEDIVGIGLERKFKHENTPKLLNIFTRTQVCYTVVFDNLKDLIEARNVIFRVLNTVVADWEGPSFEINEDTFKNYKRLMY